MRHTFTQASLTVALGLFSCMALGANNHPVVRGSQLPEIQCTATRCTFVESPSPPARFHTLAAGPLATATPATADPTPAEVGPPAGQRYMWYGAGYPACQPIGSFTSSSPYEYVTATNVPVPLGSTHASLLASFQVNLGGGPAGSAGDVGMLQVKRSSYGSWNTVNAGYAYTLSGTPTPSSQYNIGTYHALVNLATLPGGTGVPSEVDVRVIAFPLYTTGFTNVVYNAVCWGNLQLSF